MFFTGRSSAGRNGNTALEHMFKKGCISESGEHNYIYRVQQAGFVAEL